MKVHTTQRAARLTLQNFILAARAVKDAFFSGTPAQLAAGVAYYGTLSFFPLIAAMVAIASMTLTNVQVTTIVNELATYMPSDIANLLSTQLQNASMHQQANFVVMILALGLSIFGVSGAIDSIMKAITTIYHIKDTRSFFMQKAISIGLTLGLIAGMALVLPLVFIGAGFMTRLGAPYELVAAFSIARWLLLLALAITGLSIVYHFALPGRRSWRWISWGSIVATILWLAITGALFIYLQYFSNFSNSYSLFAGIIALMMWINFSAFTVLIGADVNRAFDQTLVKK